MGANPAVEGELLELLSGLQVEREAVRREADLRIAGIDEKISAVRLTLDLYHQSGPTGSNGAAPAPAATPLLVPEPQSAGSSIPTSQWAQKLKGLTQPQALVRIAELGGGTLRAAEAKRIFIATGLAKGKPKYAAGHIYHMIRGSERFERVAPGVFQLIAEPAS